MTTFLEAERTYLASTRRAIEGELDVPLGDIRVVCRSEALQHVIPVLWEAHHTVAKPRSERRQRIETALLQPYVSAIMHGLFLFRGAVALAVIGPQRSVIVSNREGDSSTIDYPMELLRGAYFHELYHIGLKRYGVQKRGHTFKELDDISTALKEGFSEVATYLTMAKENRTHYFAESYIPYLRALWATTKPQDHRTPRELADIVLELGIKKHR
jgi:hypothetical protein